MVRFRVHNLRHKGNPVDRDNLNNYLWRLHDRLHNAIHAETRVYTCRSWRATGGATEPYELHWNDETVPGEICLGSFGLAVGGKLVEQMEAEFANKEAVRLFIFNSDADLCFEEVLEPLQET
jgi:hypothetical protein